MRSMECKSVMSGMRRTCVFEHRRLLLALVGLVSLSSAVSAVSSEDSYKDAYQQLALYGFPTGLLPDTVTGYSLEDNGRFAVYLKAKCVVYVPDAFPVTYSKTITGLLAFGDLEDLSGITVKAFYFNWSIKSITVSNGDLIFDVGLVTAKYPINNFDEVPTCGKQSLMASFLEE